jgi:hypothetical protein
LNYLFLPSKFVENFRGRVLIIFNFDREMGKTRDGYAALTTTTTAKEIKLF